MQITKKIKNEIIDNYKSNYMNEYDIQRYISLFYNEIKNDYLLNDDEMQSIVHLLMEEIKSNF